MAGFRSTTEQIFERKEYPVVHRVNTNARKTNKREFAIPTQAGREQKSELRSQQIAHQWVVCGVRAKDFARRTPARAPSSGRRQLRQRASQGSIRRRDQRKHSGRPRNPRGHRRQGEPASETRGGRVVRGYRDVRAAPTFANAASGQFRRTSRVTSSVEFKLVNTCPRASNNLNRDAVDGRRRTTNEVARRNERRC